MGCFNSTKSKQFSMNTDRLCQYPRTSRIAVKLRNASGNELGTQPVTFPLTEPSSITSKEITIGSERILISSCILPGLDPRGEYKKKCQDNCFYLYDNDCILCCLFDGHGGEGEKVAAFCEKIIGGLFNNQRDYLKVNSIQNDPFAFIKLATETCDGELSKKSSGIDSEYSGW